ncbi:MAG TPA: lytic transglycosylase domain-containing protein [Acidimicrobiia bacterium]|nr:lytic transglycosylase domain-containing protein [Acidimicrobiia bacterium]
MRRAIVAFALVDLLIIVVIVVLIGWLGGSSTQSSAPRLPGFVTGRERRRLAPDFDRAARESHVPASLVMALGWRESEWEQGLVSNVGAVGIGQLLPANAAFVASSLLHEPRLDPRRAADNIRLTAGYLRALIDELGRNERLGVGAYLQGSTSVRAQGLAPETVAYVDQVEGLRTAFDQARRAG